MTKKIKDTIKRRKELLRVEMVKVTVKVATQKKQVSGAEKTYDVLRSAVGTGSVLICAL